MSTVPDPSKPSALLTESVDQVDIHHVEIVNVHQAKTHLSALLARVAQGEEIVITRNGTLIARLIAADPEPKRVPGRFAGQIRIHGDFFEDLPEAELKAAEGDDELEPLV